MQGRDPRELREEMAHAEGSQKRAGPWRDNLYGRIRVSKGTMDKIVIGLIVLLLAALALGIATGNR